MTFILPGPSDMYKTMWSYYFLLLIHALTKFPSGRRGARGDQDEAVGDHRLAVLAAAAPLPAGRPRPYCYSCGVPPLVKHHHYSTGCNTPKADHKWDATYVNQMGGKKA